MLFNTLLKRTTQKMKKKEDDEREQRGDLHDDIRGELPIQLLTPLNRA